MNDRVLVIVALFGVIGFMAFLVVFKGCSASDPVMVQFATLAAGLGGGLTGISRGAHPDTVTTTTTGNPPETKTESK